MTKRKTAKAPALPAGPFDKRAMIEELLARCRAGAETCFSLDPGWVEAQVRVQGFAVGAKLIKTALELAALLEDSPDRRGEFVHRIIVERAPAAAPDAALAGPPPPPAEKTAKTIPGGSAPPSPQDGNESA